MSLPPQPATPVPGWRRILLWASGLAGALALLGLWLVEIVWPEVPRFDLDPSWQAALAHAHDQGWQSGTQVVFSYGPWGYLMLPLWLHDALTPRLLWEFGGKLLLIVLAGVEVWRFPPWRRTVLGFAAVSAFIFHDAFYHFVILVLVVGLLTDGKRFRRLAIVTAVALAWLTLLKYTLLVESVLGMGAALAAWAWRREWRRLALVGGTYVASLVALWLLAGQAIGNFPRYVINGFEVSRGYESAMISDTPARLLAWGVAVAAAMLGWLALLAGRGGARERLLALFGLVVLDLNWKHSFIRAGDDHIRIFFLVAVFVALSLPWPERRRRAAIGFGGLALGLALGGCFVTYRGWRDLPARMLARVTLTAGRLADLTTYGAQWRRELAACRASVDPELREVVGRASVDVFNYEQGEAVVAGLDYRPRPTLQGYCAYTPPLLEMNQRFYASPSAPDCVLIKWQTIDARFPTLDDAWMWRDFGRWYRPAGGAGGFLVARRLVAATAPQREPEPVERREVRLGETFALPPDRSCALQLKVIARPSVAGRLRALVYKPAGLELRVVDTDGVEHRYRLVADMAREGFVIGPLLETQAELAEYLAGIGSRWIESASVEARPGEAWLWHAVEIEVAKLPAVPMRTLSAPARFVADGVGDREPAVFDRTMRFAWDAGRIRARVETPAEIAFAPTPEDRRLSGDYGLAGDDDPAARGPVEFFVLARERDRTERILWRQTLDPARDSAARGRHEFQIALPSPVPETVVLQTRPVRDGAPAGAWWGNLRFGATPAGEVADVAADAR